MAADLTSKDGINAFLQGKSAVADGAPPVHMDAARADTVRRVLQQVRLDGTARGHWNHVSAAAFADEIGRGELADNLKETTGSFPVDSRGWPCINVMGKLVSLDPDHDCHVSGKNPRVK